MSMDTEYLKAAVGNALSTGIAETVLVRPDDPVDYLAQRLLKWVEDSHAKTAAIAAEEEAKDKQVRAADAAAVVEREKKQRRGSTASKVQKEDDRLTKLLDAASSSAEVLNASLEYLRGRPMLQLHRELEVPDRLLGLGRGRRRPRDQGRARGRARAQRRRRGRRTRVCPVRRRRGHCRRFGPSWSSTSIRRKVAYS